MKRAPCLVGTSYAHQCVVLPNILHQRERGSNPFNQFDHFTAGSALCTRTTLKKREVGLLIRTTIACVNASRSIQQVTARIG